MKGVILAGGTGSRLHPLTRITNKHLLPIYDRPMVTYAIEALVSGGLTEIMVVTGGTHAGEFFRLLGDGHEHGIGLLQYAYQEREGGIAEALGLAERFAGGDSVLVMLADNVFGRSIKPAIENFERQERGARIVLSKVEEPEHLRHLGVAELDGDKVVRILEKPEQPPSDYAVTGLYFYDSTVFDFLPSLSPSDRGELEITDVNNWFVEQGDDGVRRGRGLLGRRGRVDRRLLRGQRLRAPERRQQVIEGLRRIPLRRFEDGRGWFVELNRASWHEKPMRQTNVSFSKAGVIRGLHYHERGQDDLFVCLEGTARVVVLDLSERRDVHGGHRRREPGCDLRPRPLRARLRGPDRPSVLLPRDRGVRPGRPGRARGAVERPARRRPVEHEIADPVGTGPGRVLITGAGGQLGAALAEALPGSRCAHEGRLGRHAPPNRLSNTVLLGAPRRCVDGRGRGGGRP